MGSTMSSRTRTLGCAVLARVVERTSMRIRLTVGGHAGCVLPRAGKPGLIVACPGMKVIA